MVTGQRRGELCAIRWRHLDLVNGVLHLERRIGQIGADLWEEQSTKTHSDRRVVLDPETVALMVEHRQRCVARARALGAELSSDAFVFSFDPDGTTPRRPESVTQRYRRMCKQIGVRTTIYKLRHYSATELILAGVDIRTVGLLPEVERTEAGYRLCSDEHVVALRFIRQAQTLGLTLAEIGDILEIRRGGAPPCRHVL